MSPKRCLLLALPLALLCAVWSAPALAKPFALVLEEAVAALGRARGEWLPHVDAAANLGACRVYTM